MMGLTEAVRTPRVLMLLLLLMLRDITLCAADEDEEIRSEILKKISEVLERIEAALARLMELISPPSPTRDATTTTEPPDENSTIIIKDDTTGNVTVTEPVSTELPNITIDSNSTTAVETQLNSTTLDSSETDSKEDNDDDNDGDSGETTVTTATNNTESNTGDKTDTGLTKNSTGSDTLERKNVDTASGSVTNVTGNSTDMINEGGKVTTETTTLTKNPGDIVGGTTEKPTSITASSAVNNNTETARNPESNTTKLPPEGSSGQTPNDHHADDPEEFQNDNLEEGDDPAAHNPDSEIEKSANSTVDLEKNKPEKLNNPSTESPTTKELPEKDLKGVIEIEAEFLSNLGTNRNIDGSEASSEMKSQSLRDFDSSQETKLTEGPNDENGTMQTLNGTTEILNTNERNHDGNINISNNDTKVATTVLDTAIENKKKNSSKASGEDSEDLENENDKTVSEDESGSKGESIEKLEHEEDEVERSASEDDEGKNVDGDDEEENDEDASEIGELAKENSRSDEEEDESEDTEKESENYSEDTENESENESVDTEKESENESEDEEESENYSDDTENESENDSEDTEKENENESEDTENGDEYDSEDKSEGDEKSEEKSKQIDSEEDDNESKANDSENEDKSEYISSEEYDSEDKGSDEENSSENASESEEEPDTKEVKDEEDADENDDHKTADKPEDEKAEEEPKKNKATKDKKRSKRSIDDKYEGVCKTGVFVDGKDLCKRLNDILTQTDEVMLQVSSGNISEWHLKALETHSQTLDEIVTEIEKDPKIFDSINKSLIASKIKDTELQVKITNAFVTGSEEIGERIPILVIAISTAGGVIVLALFVLLCYCCLRLASIRQEKRRHSMEDKVVVPRASRKISSLDRYNHSFSHRDTMPVGGGPFSPPSGLEACRPIPRPRSTLEAFDMNGRIPYDTYSLPRDSRYLKKFNGLYDSGYVGDRKSFSDYGSAPRSSGDVDLAYREPEGKGRFYKRSFTDVSDDKEDPYSLGRKGEGEQRYKGGRLRRYDP